MPCHSHFPQTFFSLCHVAQRLQQGQCFLCNVYPANGLWESHPPCAEEAARQASLNDNLLKLCPISSVSVDTTADMNTYCTGSCLNHEYALIHNMFQGGGESTALYIF